MNNEKDSSQTNNEYTSRREKRAHEKNIETSRIHSRKVEKQIAENQAIKKEEPVKPLRKKKEAAPKKKKPSPLTEAVQSVEGLEGHEKRQALREKENSIVKKIISILVIVFLGVLLVLGITFFSFWKSGERPLDTHNTKTELVEIPLGSSNKQIGSILEKQKIIKSAVVFNYYMKLHNHGNFQAGFYKLSPSMTLENIADKLKSGKTSQQVLPIPEGLTIDEVAEKIAKSTPFKKNDFLNLMKDPEFLKAMAKKYPKLLESATKAKDERYLFEGYLFPATYTLTPGGSMKGLVEQMLQKTDEVLGQYYDDIKKKNLNVHEVLTLASLVEKEGATEDNRRNIAQVFFNRMNINMPLQSDVAIHYAKGEYKEKVSIEDTKIDSPYNLYKHPGYGPGPLNNPSESAIKAVLYPQANDYLYFVADIHTGKVYFSQTLEEHNILVEKYVNQK